MNQLSIFKRSKKFSKKSKAGKTLWKLYVDGASRNNPGLAGAGIYLIKNDEPVLKKSFFLGIKTNNQAEYLALLLGLFFLRNLIRSGNKIHIFSDSQLLVRQLQGKYKVKNPNLKILSQAVISFLTRYNFNVEHIERKKNIIADKLANRGINLKKDIPNKSFYNFIGIENGQGF